MSDLAGLPDWGAPLGGGVPAFAAYAAAGSAVVLPDTLAVAARPDGTPAFDLALVRWTDAGGGLGSYGALALEVAAHHPLEEALALARGAAAGATVAPAALAGGFAGLLPAGSGLDLPADLLAPAPLAWSGATAARWNLRLSATAADLLAGGLGDRGGHGDRAALLLTARVEAEILGVAPRLPLRVRFDAAALLAALLPQGARRIARGDLLPPLARPAGLPLAVEGELAVSDAPRFAEAMAGRLCARFGRLAPEGVVEFDLPAAGLALLWDLAEPAATPLSWRLELDPLAAAREVVARAGLDAVVRRVTVPPLAAGFAEVGVAANLPALRPGVLALGVTLRVPPRPPFRLQEVVQTLDLAPPDDGGRISFRLSPGEPLAYTATPWAVVETARGAERLAAAPMAREGAWLSLAPTDFPLTWVGVSASPALLALAGTAGIAGTLSYRQGAAAAERPFELTAPGSPAVALALPPDAEDARLTFTARPAGGGSPLALGPLPARTTALGLASFPGYGPHRVTVRASFPAPGGLLAVDLLPEGVEETPQTVASLALTPAAPEKEWGYVAASPFAAGYRYRIHAGSSSGSDTDAGAPAAPWSPVQSPFVPLELQGGPAMTRPDTVDSFDLDGVHLYLAEGEPGVVRYVPGAPGPERGPDGQPTLTMIASDRGGILQLATRWALDEAALAALASALAAARPDLAGASLQPAPAQVTAATLKIAGPDGSLVALKESAGSGMPPWSAVFAATLDAGQKAAALAALNGRRGQVVIDYAIALPPEAAGTGASAGAAAIERRTDVADWFPAGAGQRRVLLTGASI